MWLWIFSLLVWLGDFEENIALNGWTFLFSLLFWLLDDV